MKIDLREQFKSITNLSTEELPDFAVLIGRNGAGKTQLFEALQAGSFVIPGIRTSEIERYDIGSFRPPNTNRADLQASQFAKETSEAYILSRSDNPSLIKTATLIFDRMTSDIESKSGAEACEDFVRDLRAQIQNLPTFTVFAASDQGSPFKKDIYEQVLAPLDQNRSNQTRRSSDRSGNSFNGNRAALVTAAMKRSGKFPHELTHDDILRASHTEGDTIANSISEVFATYKIQQYLSAHDRFEAENGSLAEFIADHRSENPPPWDTFREILSEMRDEAGGDGLFDFDFSDPDHLELSMRNFQNFSFTAAMTNRTTNTQYDLESLSSGEKILMTLCLVSFNQYLGRRRPKLLLLDEIDALLHPSMVRALVRTLKALFVSKGTKVLMTSHSPMTVATLDETDVFRVARTGGLVVVANTTKSEAIQELSEGLATVDLGLRIVAYDSAKITILTEGNNTKHLKRWAQLHFPEEVYVFEGLVSKSGSKQLLTYGRFLQMVNANTHFVIVWDCDATPDADALRKELPEDSKVTPFSFSKRENAIVSGGIENNYDEDILEPYSTTTTANDGSLLGRGFQSNRKTEFADRVLREGTPQWFGNFQDLHDVVSKVLRSRYKSWNQMAVGDTDIPFTKDGS